MSNLDVAPVEETCAAAPGDGMEVLHPRDVPLGGPRAIRVRRTLPQRQRSLVGAWCFADHYGPHDVRRGPGMNVPPHPHAGLQTVSWLFSGEIEHRDSAGVHAQVRPGELNLMTAGAGICHSEVSTAATEILHGVQLWVALPDADRDTARNWDHFVPEPVSVNGAALRVFLGELADTRSPVSTFTGLLGAQLDLPAGATLELPVDPGFEHGLLLDRGEIAVADVHLGIGDLAYRGAGEPALTLRNVGAAPARALLLGGTPLRDELVMWWNFVGRRHEDIVKYRELWESHDERFGDVAGYVGPPARLSAPPLPTTRLTPRAAGGRKDER